MEKALPRTKRISYGLAESGLISVEVLVRVSLLIFYTDVVGLRSDLAGYAIALATLWDAITDPFMGRLSDQRPMYGQKRRPYMLFGALCLGVAVIVLFFPPNFAEQWQKCSYLLLSYMFLNTAMTIASVPYAAFAGDLTRDESVRTELFGWRILCGNFGFVVGTVMPGLMILVLEQSRQQYVDSYASLSLSVFVVLTMMWTWWMTRGLDVSKERQEPWKFSLQAHIEDMTSVLGNRDFRWILGIYFIATIGLTLNSSLALYYYRYRLLLEEVDIRIILTVFMFVFSLSIPFWVVMAKRFNKYTLIAMSIFCLGGMTCIVYPMLPIGDAQAPLVASIVGGVFVGAIVLLDVAVADIADQDHTKESCLGLYFGFWKFVGKVSRAFALMLTGHVLSWIGFVSNVEQTPLASQRLAMIFGPVVGAFLVMAAFFVHLAFCRRRGKETAV